MNSNPDVRRQAGRRAITQARPASCRASRARPGTPATRPMTTAGTTASSRPARRSRCSSGTSTTCRSRTRWSSTSRSASGTSARSSARRIPNRRYLFAGTSSGTINDTIAADPAANGTILDRLDAHHIDWAIYYEPPSYPTYRARARTPHTPARAARVQARSTSSCPTSPPASCRQFTFLDPNYETTSEENPQDIQLGERYIAQVVNALMRARTWKNTALFITYDEHGGYYDHVPPPRRSRPTRSPPIARASDDVAGRLRPLRLPRAA